MRLIGINGFKRSGKDTTYQLVRGLCGDGVQRAAFADKLKIMAAKALGFDRSDDDLIQLMDSFKDTADFRVLYAETSDAHAQLMRWGNTAVPRAEVPAGLTKHEFTGRQYLQWFGAHARTVFGDDFWVDQILPSPALMDGDPRYEQATNDYWLRAVYPTAEIVCVTDVRYPNEAKRVQLLGGEVWEIVRPGLKSDGHSSERPLPRMLVDHTIINDGTIDDFRAKIQEAL